MDPFSHNRESTYTSLTRSDSDTSSLLTTSQSIHHNHPTTTKTTYKAYRPGLVHQHSIASIQPSIIEETPSPPRSRPGSRNSHAFSRLVGPPSLNERGSANGALLGEGSERVLWAEARHVRQTSEGSNDVRLDAALLRESNVSGELSRPVSKQYFRNARRIRSEWRTGRMRRFPCRGIGGLFVVGLLTGSSTALIFAAQNTQPSQWQSAQPNVYLSIIELATIMLTLTSFLEGLIISFWTNLLLSTSTLSFIHDSANPIPSLKNILRLQWNKLGVATLFTLLSLARGPLFQQAISLTSTPTHDLTPETETKIYIYTLSLPFLITALLISFLSIIAILPLYSNYSILGRSMSLNPLEIARAFGAPVFDGVDGNAGTRDILFEKGHVRVRYGVVESERYKGEKVLRVEKVERGNVRRPRVGEIFG